MRDVSPGVQVIENWAEACSSSGVMGLFRQAGVPLFPFLPRIVRISFLPWLQLDKVRKALGSHWCWVLTALPWHIISMSKAWCAGMNHRGERELMPTVLTWETPVEFHVQEL